MLGLHILLAAGLAAFSNALSPLGVFGAFVLVYLVLKFGAPVTGLATYVKRVELGTRFIVWFAIEVVKASLDVARLVLARRVRTEPAVVRVVLTRRDERLATLIGCLLTLTPGTMALDYEPEAGALIVHALDVDAESRVEADVREIESRLLAWVDANEPDREGVER
ncbi:MAG TPA: Na+/H+ antiporter subunit E [Rhodocyclaceae bacterium]|nr:Na+/H+ antiporter subunit E [Rhodocyclaceae bacterium]